jgi:hypothetical protein
MTLRWVAAGLVLFFVLSLLTGSLAWCQEPPAGSAPAPDGSQPTQRPVGEAGQREGRGRPIFGKISALQTGAIEVTGADGSKVKLKLTSSTEYRKDREPAKFSDFKVGDPVVVRTDQENGDGTTALMVASGSFAGRGGAGPGGGAGMFGTLGKDFVVGDVTAIDPPKLTIKRIDNVAQTLELNEETSLRRGRDAATMADIQTGDHIFARGAVVNDVFVPKNVNVIAPEQWKRMEEMMNNRANAPAGTGGPARPPAAAQNPPE